jgi:hypothetical protein
MQGGYGGGAPGGGGGWGPPPGGAPPGGAPPGGGYGGPPQGAPPGGGYGAPPGGGFGAPPGAPPPGGGYGAPPPGGGWAPPPQGGNPGGGGFNPYGAPGAGGPQQTGAGRFFKTAAIGGAIGGVLSSIPLVSALNCCFCLLYMAGAVIGIQLYLKENPQEMLSNGDAATSGAISGAITGVIAGVLGILVNLIFGGAGSMAALAKSLPPDVVKNFGWALAGGASIIGVIFGVIIYTGFGALGGFLGIALFFKDRARK